ncbi:MAG: metallophosphoesterase [Candidatus Asgardarchaeia archaeon]
MRINLIPLFKEKALIIKCLDDTRGGYLIISDLHLGFEKSLRNQGIIVPKLSRRIIDRLISIVDFYAPNTLVLLGDLKDSIYSFSRYEKELLRYLISTLLKKNIKIVVVKGNHDSHVGKYINEKFNLKITNYYSLFNSIILFHGHYIPRDAILYSIWITSHIHPVVHFSELGITKRYPVFLFADIPIDLLFKELNCISKIKNMKIRKLKNKKRRIKIYIIPSFNDYLLGRLLTYEGPETHKEINKKRLSLTELLNAFQDSFKIYFNNGTFLGSLKSLKEQKLFVI